MPNRIVISLALALAALAWPSLYEFVSVLAASPLERALGLAHCGAAATGSALLGHCAVCWSGAAVLLAASGLVLKAKSERLGRA